ncbi:uncharacterized protein DUF4192 [Brevibacterium sanguinis]|uniref:Uncharacterized protein DUF4192 n=2 Tax=Brevibacterium TaxID=1696 RepID=A0A366IGN3_9MICO|nr:MULTISPECIES: DUF4192 family protein [Brevibacterium]RBP64018.1 uncharacterized protein DUF4192 [Brevibacterium sanguinis]RBP70707.1 uncharacterized protein DUF4192 [Brevibacterium celere]
MHTTARTAEDIVGMVPHTLGYIPHRSLVAIIITTDERGVARCETTLRIDFDLDTAAHIVRESGRWVTDLIVDACRPSGVFFVLYDEDYPGADEGALVHRGLVRAAMDEIAMALEAESVDTLSAWWVGGNRFGRIDRPDDEGAPLETAASSACATELIAGGSAPARAPEDLVVRPAAVDEAERFRPGFDEWLDIGVSFDVLTAAYPRITELRRSDDDLDRGALTEIMHPLLVMAIDAMLRQKWSRDALEMIFSFNHPDFRPADLIDCPAGELACRALEYGSSARAAMETVGLSHRRPRPRDIRLTIEFFKHYLPWGHPEVRASAYAVIAWFEWAGGGSTMAEQYARAALDLDADHVMAGLVLRAVDSGYLPKWLDEARSRRGRTDSPRRE